MVGLNVVVVGVRVVAAFGLVRPTVALDGPFYPQLLHLLLLIRGVLRTDLFVLEASLFDFLVHLGLIQVSHQELVVVRVVVAVQDVLA
mmetsp:Transcript_30079/g.29324  ORF Transcript_30079/g.29324 Transcript_30079/m.29324 type:complete len:88 (-) Transcript_30079:99-362(-)